eukprot:TRINITY_DN80821_c0_g1_i1.p1 TRINITY_DN80821_c0_g1~~TRINITY_DN80821_c0_g1_i1.p1  ORF type:complete len:328 (+),score=57.01 TRINITY_DN80821_c0_g1_i1:235-1218(+)
MCGGGVSYTGVNSHEALQIPYTYSSKLAFGASEEDMSLPIKAEDTPDESLYTDQLLFEGVCRAVVDAVAASSSSEPSKAQKQVGIFDSSVVPPIPIDRYLLRLKTQTRCTDANFVIMLVIMDRLLRGPSQAFEDKGASRLVLTLYNVHRLVMTCLLASVKYTEDYVYSNAFYAKAGGLQLKEVNRLERYLLQALDFDLRVTPEEYKQYAATARALSPNAARGLAQRLSHDESAPAAVQPQPMQPTPQQDQPKPAQPPLTQAQPSHGYGAAAASASVGPSSEAMQVPRGTTNTTTSAPIPEAEAFGDAKGAGHGGNAAGRRRRRGGRR